jgi:DHA1 family bicyclomycin/chloramphenicol resistance-like MFS transporter
MASNQVVKLFDRTTPPHLVTLVLLAGISALNMSIFLPSLSNMTTYFGTNYATMQISVSGYLAATAILQIFVGPISDKFGRRSVVLWSIAIFVLATIGAMLSTTVETFLVFRMLQAAVASSMVLSRAIVRDMFPQDQAASMIGYVTMGMALVPMVGPMIGGAIDQFFGWQAIFGFLALSGAGVFLLCLFDQGETVRDGGMGFGEQLRTYPELLMSPRFWGYALAAAFGSGAFFALLGGASFVSSDIFGLTPFWAGVALGVPAIGYAIGNGFSGKFSVRFGINRLAIIGTLITLSGLGVSLIVTLMGYSNPLLFFGFVTFLGLGNGMLMPNATAGLLSVRPHLAGTASGLGGTILIGGGAALSQVAGYMLTKESGTLPLQWLMFATSVLALIAMIFVIYRARKLDA